MMDTSRDSMFVSSISESGLLCIHTRLIFQEPYLLLARILKLVFVYISTQGSLCVGRQHHVVGGVESSKHTAVLEAQLLRS